MPLTADKARKLIGKRVTWNQKRAPCSQYRGYCFPRYGILEDVKGKNVWIDGDARWLPDLHDLRAFDGKED
jgi:hypothetical protein